jgi:hypothetical protein
MHLRFKARVSRDGFGLRCRRLALRPELTYVDVASSERPMAGRYSADDLHERLPGWMPENGSPNA